MGGIIQRWNREALGVMTAEIKKVNSWHEEWIGTQHLGKITRAGVITLLAMKK